MFFQDPANIFVVVIMGAFIAFVIAIKINSDKVTREEKEEKVRKENKKD